MKVINKISEIGNTFFDWLVDGVLPLPGIIKGLIVIVVFILMVIGVLSLLKKSLKVFGVILSVIAIIILISIFLK